MSSIVASRSYRFGAFELQVEERRLLRESEPVALRPHAFDVLCVMVERAGHLVTKDELLQRVWGQVIVEENTLQAHVSALRKILGPEAIATVSGQGYRFTPGVAVDAPAASNVSRHNLPNSLTSFIGREKQISDVRQLLASARLLTLTGAGGCGKTRLALRVAGDALTEYQDGVWLVELTPLSDPTLIPQAIAKALALKEQVDRPLMDTVEQWLESRHVLLLLDNAEHLLDSCAQIAERLLTRCARLSILATSRERLGFAGELTFRVPSLSIPESKHLFVERARLQRPDFEVPDKDAAALASICHRLDGIALAIELAAARVRAMSLEELDSHLDDRFGVLTGGSRTAPRHRTLRSLIDWSYDLLSDDEKAILRRASVFAGGWTTEAADSICGGEDPVDRRRVLDLLTSLVDKNLVVAETQAGVTRFSMLETIRHYAHDRLKESGEEIRTRSRHLAFLHGLAGLLDGAGDDAELQAALGRLDPERDNLRAALAWCETDAARSIEGLGLAGKLYYLWLLRGPFGEGRDWIVRLLSIAPDAELGQSHARALHVVGTLTHRQGDFDAADEYHRQALSIWRRLGDRRQMARSIGSLGNIALRRHDFPNARTLYEEAIAITREIGDRRSTATGLGCLGVIAAETGDLDAARIFLEESLSINRGFGRVSTVKNLLTLARIWSVQRDYVKARAFAMEALQIQHESGDRRDTAFTLTLLAMISHDEGDFSAAKAQFREAFAAEQAGGASMYLPDMLEAFANLSLELAPATCAGRLWGSAENFRERTGHKAAVIDSERNQRHIDRARRALQDDAALDRAWAEGRSWSTDEAVKYAMELLSSP